MLSYILDECPSGQELSSGGVCNLCEVGTYRTSGVHSLCTSCPVGNTTLTTGSKVMDDCNISKSLLNKSLNKLSVKVLVGRLWCFNATFNNISVITWWLVLLVEKTGVPRENHRPVASH